jgi:hypothetical protein
MEMDAETAFEAVLKLLKAIPDSGVHDIPSGQDITIMADENYSTVTRSQVTGMMKTNPLLSPTNVKPGDELADCDDFALQLKAALTARARQDNLATGTYNLPPAIGIIFSMNHALSVFVTLDANGDPVAMLADASRPDQPMTGDPGEAAALLLKLPVRFVYI